MASDELLTDLMERLGDRELAGLVRDLCDEDRLEHKVAELVTERQPVAPVDRVDDLVGFLDHERPEGFDRLLTVPGAALGRAEDLHDLDEPVEGVAGGRAGGRW